MSIMYKIKFLSTQLHNLSFLDCKKDVLQPQTFNLYVSESVLYLVIASLSAAIRSALIFS